MGYVHASPRVHNARLKMVVPFNGQNAFWLAALQIDSKLKINRLKLPLSYHSQTHMANKCL